MTCRDIMTAPPVALREGDAVGDAVEKLLGNRFVILPVVDGADRYSGVFGVFEAIRLIVPRAATLDNLVPQIDFIAENLGEVQARLGEARGRPVGPLARHDHPVLRPQTPILEALLQFYRYRTPMPVVEQATGRLMGVVSYWDALSAIARPVP